MGKAGKLIPGAEVGQIEQVDKQVKREEQPEQMKHMEPMEQVMEQVDKIRNQSFVMEKQLQKTSPFKCELCKDTGYIIKPQINAQPLMTPCK